MIPFDPLFRNPHLQTIAGHYWKRPAGEGFLEPSIRSSEEGTGMAGRQATVGQEMLDGGRQL